jgi:hypothetical protein
MKNSNPVCNVSDSQLLDWLEEKGGEVQFSNLSGRWWCNWYNGEDGSDHKSGPMCDTVREALKLAYAGTHDE